MIRQTLFSQLLLFSEVPVVALANPEMRGLHDKQTE